VRLELLAPEGLVQVLEHLQGCPTAFVPLAFVFDLECRLHLESREVFVADNVVEESR
jgi:hypothetical protein